MSIDAGVSRSRSGGFIARKVMWAIALLVMGFSAVDGFLSFAIQTTAPQQAAAAASACFRVIAPYVIARALDVLLRNQEHGG